MLGVVTEAPKRYAALDRLDLGWDQRVDAALLKSAIDFAVSVAGIRGDGFNINPRGGFDFVHLRFDHLAFVCLSGRDFDVQNDADFVVDCRVPLISGLQSPIPGVRGHRGVGIGDADLLELAALAACPLEFSFLLSLIIAEHTRHMPLDQAIPTHIGPDKRGIDVHNLSRSDLRLEAGFDCAFDDFTEPLFAPALANAR